MTLEQIRERLIALAGGGVNLNPALRRTRGIGLYSSMTLAGLEDIPAVRNTMMRINDFGVPHNLSGKNVLDVGSNEGSFSFEFALRGATVLGIEHRQDRVDLCRDIVEYHASAHDEYLSAQFECGDFVEMAEDWVVGEEFKPFDYVNCLCVTKFVPENRWDDLYIALRKTSLGGVVLLETNCGSSKTDVELMLYRAGFTDLVYLGSSSRHRKAYRAS